MLEVVPLAVGLAVVFAAGLVQGLLGFGFALVSVPVLVLLVPPRAAVPAALLLGTAINIVLYWHVRSQANLRRMVPLLIAGIAGLPIGTYLLAVLDPGLAKIVIGCLITAFALASLAGFERPIRREALGLAATGVASGILNGIASASGPPVVLFLANQGMTRDAFRATLIAYFLFLDLANIPVYWGSGLFSREIVAYAGALLPALVAGALVGNRLCRLVPERLFRQVALAAVAGTGALSVLSGIGLF